MDQRERSPSTRPPREREGASARPVSLGVAIAMPALGDLWAALAALMSRYGSLLGALPQAGRRPRLWRSSA